MLDSLTGPILEAFNFPCRPWSSAFLGRAEWKILLRRLMVKRSKSTFFYRVIALRGQRHRVEHLPMPGLFFATRKVSDRQS